MKNKMEESIIKLADQSVSSDEHEALAFSQAALNLAQALAIVIDVRIVCQERRKGKSN